MRWLRLARATRDARLPQPYDCQLPGIAMNSTSRPEAAVRLPFIECLLIDIGTQWEACVQLRPDAGALGHPPSNQACRKRRDGI